MFDQPGKIEVVLYNPTLHELAIDFMPQGILSKEAERTILIEAQVVSFIGELMDRETKLAIEAAIHGVIGRLQEEGALRWSYNRQKWVIDMSYQWSPS